MSKMLVFRVESKFDADKVFKFFYALKGKTVKINDISLTGLGRSQKTVSLWVEEE